MAPRVLIVDDEPDIATGCARFLKQIGLDSILAFSVESAISLVRSQGLALVLTDVLFPNGRDGFRVSGARPETFPPNAGDPNEWISFPGDGGANSRCWRKFPSQAVQWRTIDFHGAINSPLKGSVVASGAEPFGSGEIFPKIDQNPSPTSSRSRWGVPPGYTAPLLMRSDLSAQFRGLLVPCWRTTRLRQGC